MILNRANYKESFLPPRSLFLEPAYFKATLTHFLSGRSPRCDICLGMVRRWQIFGFGGGGSNDQSLEPNRGEAPLYFGGPPAKTKPPGRPLPAHMGWIHALRYVSDGTLLSAGIGPKGMGILRSWKPGQITPLERWVVPQGPLQALVPTPKGDRILIATGHRVRLGNTEENLSLLAPWPFPADWIQNPDSLTVPEPKRKTR